MALQERKFIKGVKLSVPLYINIKINEIKHTREAEISF